MIEAYPEDFKISIELVLKHEGGYSDHPADSGGRTNYGITEASLSDFCARSGKLWTLQTLTKDKARLFYFHEYWEPLRLSEFPTQPLKNVVLATAVHMGKVRAVKKLQDLLCITADGKVGPYTIGCLLAMPYKSLTNSYCDAILAFYESLAEKRPKDKVFLKGWKKRINSFRQA